MTKDDIKKALEICADISIPCNDCPYDAVENCNDTLSTDALKLITEQEKEIQMAQDQILFVAQQNQEYREQQVKRAKIDVLNELKKYLHTEDFDTPDERWKPESEFCAIIDELIKEVQNGEDEG